MRLFRAVLFSVSVAAISACSVNVQNGVPEAAQNVAPASGGRMIVRPLAVRPPAGAPPILISFLANGPNQGGVPCIDCVAGASSGDNAGITGPSNYVAKNYVWQYAISFADNTYKGKCTLAWTIVAGKKTVDAFSAKIDLTSSGGFVLYAVARKRPVFSGRATVTGKVTCGQTAQSLQAPMYFE